MKRLFVSFARTTRVICIALVVMLCVGCRYGIFEETSASAQQDSTLDLAVCSLNGVPLKEYCLVYADSDADYNYRAARFIQTEIERRTGIRLEVCGDYLPAQRYEIVVGDADREISKNLQADTQNVQFAIWADNGKIALEGDYFIIAAAAYFFVETYIPEGVFDAVIPQEVMIFEPIQKEVKNIIFLIGDGMGSGQTRLFDVMNVSDSEASIYSDGEDVFYGYYFPSQGRVRTNSLSGVTDSAAASTALSTGYKTKNKYIGKNSMGKDVQSLTELAAELGKATAVMSTESETGATPAGFSAHVLNRDDSEGIAASQEILKNEYGTKIKCGYNVYDSVGVDQMRTDIRKTLTELSSDDDGFFLMFEEAYIDKHCESNNLSKTFCALIRFNQAIGVFMEYAFYHPDTLVLITADHETGGLTKDLSGAYVYSTTKHTESNVPVFAYGMNAGVFNNRVIENTQIPKTLAHIMGKEDFGARDQYASLFAQ